MADTVGYFNTEKKNKQTVNIMMLLENSSAISYNVMC